MYDKELLDRPKMLIVTKLDRKGATSRFQALKQNLHAITKPGREYASRYTTYIKQASWALAKYIFLGAFRQRLSFISFSFAVRLVGKKLSPRSQPISNKKGETVATVARFVPTCI